MYQCLPFRFFGGIAIFLSSSIPDIESKLSRVSVDFLFTGAGVAMANGGEVMAATPGDRIGELSALGVGGSGAVVVSPWKTGAPLGTTNLSSLTLPVIHVKALNIHWNNITR